MGTIVQEYGPIYGEVVNGTVQGRPNGSVYVPISNSISIDIPEVHRYIRSRPSTVPTKYDLTICNSSGVTNWSLNRCEIVAISQDLANNIQIQVSDSADFSNIVGTYDRTAGLFNLSGVYLAATISVDPIEADASYYVRAVLMANGTPVATSTSIELVGVVVE